MGSGSTPVRVRVLATSTPDMRTTRRRAFGRREHPRRLRLEVRLPDGSLHQVERRDWVPEWVGVEQLVTSGRVLDGVCPGGHPGRVRIDWEQIEDDVTRDVLVRLGEGPLEQRLALLDELHAQGQFKPELYERARRRLAETGSLAAAPGDTRFWVLGAVLTLAGAAMIWIGSIVPVIIGALLLALGLLVLLATWKPRGAVFSLRPWRR